MINDIKNERGGALLNIIYKFLINTGDPKVKQLFTFILEKSIIPYLEILKKWIYHGKLEDQFEEFLVQESKTYSKSNIDIDFNDKYWEKRFTYRETMIPVFLMKYAEKILFTGKYLNVISECGKSINCPYEKDFDIQSFTGVHYLDTTIQYK